MRRHGSFARSLRVFVVFVVFVASSCASVLPKSAESQFFVLSSLEPVARAEPGGQSQPSVLLGTVTLPTYLDRRELVTRLASNQVRVEDLELWAEPLREAVPRALEHDLDTMLGGGKIQRLPWTAHAAPALVVSVDVRRFEKASNRTVELLASWTIGDGASGAVRTRRDTHLTLPIAGAGTQAAVKTLSDALAGLGREVAAAMREIPREGL
jgi:uncharacterized lipoprotein YmbA